MATNCRKRLCMNTIESNEAFIDHLSRKHQILLSTQHFIKTTLNEIKMNFTQHSLPIVFNLYEKSTQKLGKVQQQACLKGLKMPRTCSICDLDRIQYNL